jgi:hypothetical protein
MTDRWRWLGPPFLALGAVAFLSGPALGQGAKDEACVGPVKQDVEQLANRFAKIGAKGVIIGASCNARGNLSAITIHRPKDNRITRWKPRDGLTALFDRVMTGE